MSVLEGFRLAWRGMLANKLRAFLTALGVIIGVAAVIALVAVGQGASAQVTSRVESLGANVLTIIPERQEGTVLTLQNIANIPAQVPQVSAQMPVLSGSVTATWQDQTWSTTLQGVTQVYPQLHGTKMQSGRFLTAADVSQISHVAVLGPTVVSELQMTGDPVGQTIDLDGQPYTVIGVMQSVGGGGGNSNQDDTVLVPVTAAEPLLGTIDLSQVQYQAVSQADAPLAAGLLQAIYNHMFGHTQPPSVFVISQDQLLQTLQATTQSLTLLLGSIAGVSLLVGGIGIMNIMLVSVAERTREIGIRKAVGAKRRHILLQFLLEAAMISIAGGIIGIAGGVGAARAVAQLAGWSVSVSPLSIGVAFGFALLIGVGFGVWPALTASALDPIQALRYD